MRAEKKKHPFQTLLGYVLALLLAVSLTAACGLTLVERLLTDQALHERVALDERVLDAQAERIEDTVRNLAEEYHFVPETVLGEATKESLKTYGADMVAWWMGLIREHPETEAPFPDTAAIEEAVRGDELFRENTEDFMRRSIARDDIAYPIGLAMQEAVMPLRVQLVPLGLPELKERVDIPRVMNLLSMARTALFALAVIAMALILLTQGKRRFPVASAGLTASFVLLAVVTIAVAVVDLPEAMAAYSPLLSLQLGILMSALTLPVLLVEGAILLVALLLLLPALRGRRESDSGYHERKRA